MLMIVVSSCLVLELWLLTNFLTNIYVNCYYGFIMELVIIVENVARVIARVDKGEKHCLTASTEWGTTLVHLSDRQL